MKKIAFIIISVFTAFASSAQDYTNFGYKPVYSIHTPKIGVVGGFHLSNFYNESVGDPNFQPGFHIGTSLLLPLSQNFSFEPQLLYSKKGGELDYAYDFYYNEQSVNYRLHYIEMPFLLNIHTRGITDFIIGGYGSYLLDATFSVTTAYSYGYGELNYGDFEKYDYGLVGGMAFNFPFSKLMFKYSCGFADVAKENTAYIYLKDARNHAFSVSFIRYFR
ncbi:outer membrane beta-barrel protein [Maribellus comscasis]|uniref:Outer membrane beta-barrel protein n=1 Tax=Maribellus comscasis TaxID=2681766 RepID=A0A6I6JWW0_9BACT|nr:porin family protein [Maribellus comscasis]QGY44627.1 outer membrane beta-barrel protein [Maribellus comscasis]